MMGVYLFILVVGAGILGMSLLGGDADADLDSGSDAFKWLSLRGLSYFAFVCGGVGAALTATWHVATAPIIAALAVGSGAAVSWLATAVFAYLQRTESGAREGDDAFIGLSGRIVVPFGESGTGKVLLARADRTFEMLAKPFGGATTPPASWNSVIVVEIQNGIALVSPLEEQSASEPSLPSLPSA